MLGHDILADLAILLLAEDKSSEVSALIFRRFLIINSLLFIKMDEDTANTFFEKTIQDYDAIAEKYSEVREKDWEEMNFLFDNYLNPGDKVLDLGCGNGRFYNNFHPGEVEYTGVDPSRKLIKIAKEIHPDAYFDVAHGFAIPFEDEYFDKVFSIAVLHHIPSFAFRQYFLAEAMRVLKVGGYLILTVWDMDEKLVKRKFNPLAILWQAGLEEGDVLLPWYGLKDVYFHAFSLDELAELAQSMGLRIVEAGEIAVGEKPYNNFYIVTQRIF